jgi:hypothetical protein
MSFSVLIFDTKRFSFPIPYFSLSCFTHLPPPQPPSIFCKYKNDVCQIAMSYEQAYDKIFGAKKQNKLD